MRTRQSQGFKTRSQTNKERASKSQGKQGSIQKIICRYLEEDVKAIDKKEIFQVTTSQTPGGRFFFKGYSTLNLAQTFFHT